MITDSKTRFSNRVEAYVKHRPKYPPAVIAHLSTHWNLTPHSTVADIGAGTGISAELFLRNNNSVYAVEPNKEMREAMQSALCTYPAFHAVDGSAEHTTLPDQSVDFIVAAQAFHWFDRPATKAEFQRIARPNAVAAIMWNDRISTGSALAEGYEQLLHRFGTDYAHVVHRYLSADEVFAFLDSPTTTKTTFPNSQQLDFPGLSGRVLSASYMPTPGTPNYPEMMGALKSLFDQCQQDGKVTLQYETQLYCARVAG